MSLGPYASFIVLDYRNQTRRLRALEESGVVRRSGRGAVDLR